MTFNPADAQYLSLVNTVLRKGENTQDRTGVGTVSLLGTKEISFDLRDGFPILSTKRVPFRLVFEELKWFLSGSTNSKVLEDNNVNIWAEWGDPLTREHGPIYGKQWRDWSVIVGPFGSSWVKNKVGFDVIKQLSLKPFGHKHWVNAYCYYTVELIEDDQLLVKHVDQIQYVINEIALNPGSRRILLNSWRVDQLEEMSLTPCHNQVQFKVSNEFLDLKLYQRSADLGLGVPFNISSYALLLYLMAHHTNKIPRYFVHTFGDLHVYINHVDQLLEQSKRQHKPIAFLQVLCESKPDISDYNFSDVILKGYEAWPNQFESGPMQVAV